MEIIHEVGSSNEQQKAEKSTFWQLVQWQKPSPRVSSYSTPRARISYLTSDTLLVTPCSCGDSVATPKTLLKTLCVPHGVSNTQKCHLNEVEYLHCFTNLICFKVCFVFLTILHVCFYKVNLILYLPYLVH